MRPELLESVICNDDRECRESLGQIRETLSYINKIASSIKVGVKLERLGKPLINHVSNIDEIKRSVASKLNGEENLVDYALRRVLYVKLRGRVRASREDSLCPLCGRPPTLIFFRKTDSALFSGDIPHARCSCGMEWEYDEWRCPQCGSTGRMQFDLQISRNGQVELRTCRKCGFTLFVARRITGDRDYFHVLANMIVGGISGGSG